MEGVGGIWNILLDAGCRSELKYEAVKKNLMISILLQIQPSPLLLHLRSQQQHEQKLRNQRPWFVTTATTPTRPPGLARLGRGAGSLACASAATGRATSPWNAQTPPTAGPEAAAPSVAGWCKV